MRRPFLALLALLVAAPLASQPQPRRPRLPAQADTNDARAYFQQGQEWLERRPRDAADAFYWASQIQPGWADALYGRHVALLMSEPRRLLGYMDGDRRTLRQPEVRRIDSLYLRATRIDPLLQPRFEREMTRLWLRTALASAYGAEEADMPLVAFYTEQVLRDLPPLMRGRVLAGEGRLVQALSAYDQALRERGRRAAPERMIRFERGRMFALARNDSMALVELRHAVDAVVEEEEGDDLVVFYESKALLEHGMGRVHENAGDLAGAREAYARALVEDLAYYPAHIRLGALALVEGDTATALHELALAAQAGADDATARLSYAALLATVRRLPEAETELAAAIEIAPFFADPWLLLGMVRDWRGEGDSEAAFRGFLARARRDDPRRPQVEALFAGAASTP